MRELIKRFVLNFVKRFGFVIHRYRSGDPTYSELMLFKRDSQALVKEGWCFERPKWLRLLELYRIANLVDCGANEGQFVQRLVSHGWSGQVISFEPVSDAFAILKTNVDQNDWWSAYQLALGREETYSDIGVAGNSYSSSLLTFSDDFINLRPDAAPVRHERVHVRKLDDVFAEERLTLEGPIMLKLDVQGGELDILEGATEFLKQVTMIQCELPLIPSYEGSASFAKTREYLKERGFVLVHIIDGHSNHLTGELREVDGIFLNSC